MESLKELKNLLTETEYYYLCFNIDEGLSYKEIADKITAKVRCIGKVCASGKRKLREYPLANLDYQDKMFIIFFLHGYKKYAHLAADALAEAVEFYIHKEEDNKKKGLSRKDVPRLKYGKWSEKEIRLLHKIGFNEILYNSSGRIEVNKDGLSKLFNRSFSSVRGKYKKEMGKSFFELRDYLIYKFDTMPDSVFNAGRGAL